MTKKMRARTPREKRLIRLAWLELLGAALCLLLLRALGSCAPSNDYYPPQTAEVVAKQEAPRLTHACSFPGAKGMAVLADSPALALGTDDAASSGVIDHRRA